MSHSAVRDDVINLADAVRRAAAASADAPALVVAAEPHPNTGGPSDVVITWAEVDERVDAVAAALIALDLPAGGGARARVAIALPNSPEFAYAYFGVLRAGLVAVPINPGYTARELRHQLHDSGTSLIIATPTVISSLADVRAHLPALAHVYMVGGDTTEGVRPFADLAGAAAPAAPVVDAEDLAVLLYTSATAGAPKGAMLSHRALTAVSSQQLIDHCQRNLARFKCRAAIEFVPELPTRPRGRFARVTFAWSARD